MDKQSKLFILIVLLVSWISVFVIFFFHLSQAPMTAAMIVPLVLALAFLLFPKERRGRFSAVGWRFPKWKYGFLSFVIPLVQIGLVLGVGFCLGLLSFNAAHPLTRKPTPRLWLNLILCLPGLFVPFLLLSLPALLVGWINHLGEELAWRGFLYRRIAERSRSVIKAVFISGMTWWAWHLPMFFLSPVLKDLKLAPLVLTVLLSLPAILGTAAIYSWIYLRSGSIWAPTLMHLAWNLFRGALTGRLADGTAGLFLGPLWLINGEGIFGHGVMILTSLIFWRSLRKTDKAAFPSP